MDLTSINGLPAHPLVVHIPVVLIPLAFIGAVLLAVRPSWRSWLGMVVAVLAIVGAAGVFLAAHTGESLKEGMEDSANPPDMELLDEHVEAGDQAEPFAAVFAVLAVGVVVLDQIDRRSSASADTASGDSASGDKASGPPPILVRAIPIVVVLAAVAGAASSWTVYQAGHTGATTTWNKVVVSTEQDEG